MKPKNTTSCVKEECKFCNFLFLQVNAPDVADLPGLFDPAMLEQLSGEGDANTLMMILQSQVLYCITYIHKM